ncbi:MAG: 2-C-methyl-D-erythritol 4-phosphate cytidylyltransferase [Bacteroidetes bacterium]|nr:2-C-methyl-D-erythritol 4-phosphate cytidylyltransferase [Bacteroidota bacterium]
MNSFIVCIPAAGIGRRMDSDTPKQYLHLHGRPLLAHTINVFDGMPECAGIVLAVDDETAARRLVESCAPRVPVQIVAGGLRRQDSVANALAVCGEDDTIVLVHDAARPCVTRAHVRAVAEAVHQHGAALLALPARDTIKEVHAGLVRATLDRTVIWQAQTPQGARAGLLRIAFAEALRKGIEATDDVSLLEAMDVPVHVVEGSPNNIKITTREDLVIAEAILKLRMINDKSRIRDESE